MLTLAWPRSSYLGDVGVVLQSVGGSCGPQGVRGEGFEVDAGFGRIGPAAKEAIHDYLYRTGFCGRRRSDEVMMEAMAAEGAPIWRRRVFHLALRLFGGGAWKAMAKHRKVLRAGGMAGATVAPVRALSKGARPRIKIFLQRFSCNTTFPRTVSSQNHRL